MRSRLKEAGKKEGESERDRGKKQRVEKGERWREEEKEGFMVQTFLHFILSKWLEKSNNP